MLQSMGSQRIEHDLVAERRYKTESPNKQFSEGKTSALCDNYKSPPDFRDARCKIENYILMLQGHLDKGYSKEPVSSKLSLRFSHSVIRQIFLESPVLGTPHRAENAGLLPARPPAKWRTVIILVNQTNKNALRNTL